MSKKGSAHSQELLKYQKLYNWCRTLITSGVIKNKDKYIPLPASVPVLCFQPVK